MPEYVLLFLEALLCFLFVCLLFGLMTPYVSVSITVLLIILNWQIYSLPKTNHDILFCVTPLIMCLSGWGHYFSVDAQRNTTAQAFPSVSTALLALTITTGFAVAGLPKLMHWADFNLSTSGVRSWVTGIYFPNGGGGPLSGMMAYMAIPILWEVLDVAAVVFEVGFLFVFFRRRYFRAWLVLAVGFHFTNYLMLGIGFPLNLPVYAAFLPWPSLVRLLRQWFPQSKLLLIECNKKKRMILFSLTILVTGVLYFTETGVGLRPQSFLHDFKILATFFISFVLILFSFYSFDIYRPSSI